MKQERWESLKFSLRNFFFFIPKHANGYAIYAYDIQEIIAKTRAVSRTIKLLSSSSTDERHSAISFLVELSKSELLLENIGSTAGSILILTTMKFNSSDDPIAAEKAGEVLKNLERCPKNIKYMAESGYLDPLQRHLVEGTISPFFERLN